MKNAVYLLLVMLLALCNSLYSRHSSSGNDFSRGDSLEAVATPGLYNLAVKWAEEYNSSVPGAKVKVLSIDDQGKAGDLIKNGRIGFMSHEFYSELKNESFWNVVIGRDVIVTVINAKNPFLEEINQHGISHDLLSIFVKNVDYRNWGDLLMNGKTQEVNYYCIDDKSALRSLADFLRTDESLIAGRNTGNATEVVAAVQNDPYAFGFCKLTDILDFQNQGMVENIRLMPIDRNGNGLIDSNEKIYDDINSFSRGVWIGKYPKALFSNIYTVASGMPEKEGEVAFIKWILSDGQKFLAVNGYSDLLVSERQSAADRLYNAKVYAGASAGKPYLPGLLLFIIGTLILISLIASVIARQRKRKKVAVKITGNPVHPVLDESSLQIPKGIYFDKTHTWAFMEANGIVKVGIDDFLQHVTGKITRIKMKTPGKKVKKGDQILSIVRNGKQLNLYSPVSGTIIEQNELLEADSSTLNYSPYTAGWIYKIEPSNWIRESQLLFMADKQMEFIKKEFSRLKDFLMTALRSDTGNYAPLILQDGGEISDGVLSELGPEIWEDFQTNFIDPSRQLWFYEIF